MVSECFCKRPLSVRVECIIHQQEQRMDGNYLGGNYDVAGTFHRTKTQLRRSLIAI
jgi:hypothetical protein